MIFKLSKSYQESLDERNRKNLKWAAMFEWHPWFAWYPVPLDDRSGRWVWFSTIERKMQEIEGMYDYYHFFQYRIRKG